MVQLPKIVDMINPMLQALRNLGAPADNDEIRQEVASIVELNQAQLQVSFTRNGIKVRRIDNRLDWVKVYLGTTGHINRLTDGSWALTEKGKKQHVVDCARDNCPSPCDSSENQLARPDSAPTN